MSNRLSVVEGPPGTGKTQVILNIVANAIINNKTVAIISNNNTATRNVFEKLKNENLDFLTASLGNLKNKETFIQNQKEPNINDMLSDQHIDKSALYNQLNYLNNELSFIYDLQNKLYILKQQLSELKIEYKYFQDYLQINNIDYTSDSLNKIKSIKSIKFVIKTLIYLDPLLNTKKSMIGWITKILEFLRIINREKIFIEQFLQNNPNINKNSLNSIFQQKFYELTLKKIETNILDITNKLNTFNYEKKINLYSEISRKILNSELIKKYKNNKWQTYELFELKYKKNSEKFLQRYPIILSTTYSLTSSLADGTLYDYVIIDEASQVCICSAALSMSCAKKLVVIGDNKQLSHIVQDSHNIDEIFKKYNLSQAFHYSNNILSVIKKLFPHIKPVFLKEHFRCHPKIIDYCNKKYYNNQIIIMTEDCDHDSPMVLYKTQKGTHVRDNINQRQIDIIKKEIFTKLNIINNIGIVTPFINQRESLKKTPLVNDHKIDTIHGFQGQECDVIIFSTVKNHLSAFKNQVDNMINVIVSRAKKQLIIIVDHNDDLVKSEIYELVKYIEYNNFTNIDSSIFSIFDYLYKENKQQLHKLLKDNDKVSIYDSENLAYKNIKETLTNPNNKKFQSLDVAIHVQLNMIIRKTTLLNAQEIKYLSNNLTHVDFLIFNKIHKSVVAVIEVDGHNYHKIGTKQAERDAMKDSILTKYNIPFLRLKIGGSVDNENIKDFLEMNI